MTPTRKATRRPARRAAKRAAAATLALALALGGAGAGTARAQPVPPPVAASGIDERIGARLPLDARFTAAGRGPLALGELFDGERPVLLVLAYARCAMLCSLVLRGAIGAARALPRTPPRDYRLVVISLDARETPDEARRKQATLAAELGAGTADADALPYLVGPRASIDAVAGALGFRYAWDARTEQYAHPAVVFAITPDGRAARYLHGVRFTPAEIAAALDDAAAGRLLATPDAQVLRCFRFDPAARRAGRRAELVLRIGAGVVFAMLAGTIALLIGWERRRRSP